MPLPRGVAHGLGDHADVGLAVELERRVEPVRFGASFVSQQRPAELVFQVQVRERRQDQHRDVSGPGAGLGYAFEHAVDVAGHRPAHRQDVQARRQLAGLLGSKDVAQGLAVAVGRDREGDVHDVDAHRAPAAPPASASAPGRTPPRASARRRAACRRRGRSCPARETSGARCRSPACGPGCPAIP